MGDGWLMILVKACDCGCFHGCFMAANHQGECEMVRMAPSDYEPGSAPTANIGPCWLVVGKYWSKMISYS